MEKMKIKRKKTARKLFTIAAILLFRNDNPGNDIDKNSGTQTEKGTYGPYEPDKHRVYPCIKTNTTANACKYPVFF
jgi:hypothetical protein